MYKILNWALVFFSLWAATSPSTLITNAQEIPQSVQVLIPSGGLDTENNISYTANGRYGVIASAHANDGSSLSGQYLYAFDAFTGKITDQYWLGPAATCLAVHSVTSQVAIIHQSRELNLFGVGLVTLITLGASGQFNQLEKTQLQLYLPDAVKPERLSHNILDQIWIHPQLPIILLSNQKEIYSFDMTNGRLIGKADVISSDLYKQGWRISNFEVNLATGNVAVLKRSSSLGFGLSYLKFALPGTLSFLKDSVQIPDIVGENSTVALNTLATEAYVAASGSGLLYRFLIDSGNVTTFSLPALREPEGEAACTSLLTSYAKDGYTINIQKPGHTKKSKIQKPGHMIILNANRQGALSIIAEHSFKVPLTNICFTNNNRTGYVATFDGELYELTLEDGTLTKIPTLLHNALNLTFTSSTNQVSIGTNVSTLPNISRGAVQLVKF